VQHATGRTPPVITCGGTGVVSNAGTVLLAELADRVGLTAALSEATDSLRERRAGHHPGRVLLDVAVAIADGAVSISDVQALADPQGLHGPAGSVASTSTIWRVLDAVANTPGMLAKIRQARAQARDRAWLARGELTGAELPGSRAAGKLVGQVVIDLDATLVTAHSKKAPGATSRAASATTRSERGWTTPTRHSRRCYAGERRQQHRRRSPDRRGLGPDAVARSVARQADPDPRRRRRLLPRPDQRPFGAGPGLLRRLPRHRSHQAGPKLGLAGRVQRRRGSA